MYLQHLKNFAIIILSLCLVAGEDEPLVFQYGWRRGHEPFGTNPAHVFDLPCAPLLPETGNLHGQLPYGVSDQFRNVDAAVEQIKVICPLIKI